MSLEIKTNSDRRQAAVRATTTLMLHDVTDQSAPASAASRRLSPTLQPAASAANHARHHIARKKQS
jgi:hypothetical protein